VRARNSDRVHVCVRYNTVKREIKEEEEEENDLADGIK
jgi:hypothetical protein